MTAAPSLIPRTMSTQILTGTETETRTRTQRPWHVLLYNDSVHTFDEVVLWVQQATGCSEQKAFRITLEAHKSGRAVAYGGSKVDCERVCAALRGHGLQAEIDTAGEG